MPKISYDQRFLVEYLGEFMDDSVDVVLESIYSQKYDSCIENQVTNDIFIQAI